MNILDLLNSEMIIALILSAIAGLVSSVISILFTLNSRLKRIDAENIRQEHSFVDNIKVRDILEIVINIMVPEDETARAVLYIMDRRSGTLRMFANTGAFESDELQMQFKPNEGFVGFVWSNQNILATDLTELSKEFQAERFHLTEEEIVSQKNQRSILGIPIFRPDDETLGGVLIITSLKPLSETQFTDIEKLSMIASLLHLLGATFEPIIKHRKDWRYSLS